MGSQRVGHNWETELKWKVREPFKQKEVIMGSEFQEDDFGGDTEKEVNGGKQNS